MKNQITVSLGLILLGFLLLSNSGGRGTSGGEAVTQAPGEDGNFCGTCHSAGEFSPDLSLSLVNSSGETVDTYIPGETYEARLTISTTGDPAAYGFQMVALDGTDTQAGSWSDNLPDGVGIFSFLERDYVEHNTPLDSPEIVLPWTAPDTEEVTFYVAGNAVNLNGSTAGDGADVDQFNFSRFVMSDVNDLTVENISIFPNPTSDFISIDNTIDGTFKILDFSGNLKTQRSLDGNIDVSNLNAGIYILQIQTADKTLMSKFVKI